MRIRKQKMKTAVLALAVQGVLGAMCTMSAQAQDESPSVKAATSFAEIGLLNVSRDSYKFGEYTGLSRSGVYLNGAFGIRGGDAYTSETGIRRWQVQGDDLGLTSRSIGGSIADQGRWNFGINYDQLRHYTSDSYQT